MGLHAGPGNFQDSGHENIKFHPIDFKVIY